MVHSFLLLLAACVLFACPALSRAAESYDNCTGFITSLPATVSTQGVWCLNRNLSTAITSDAAITIAGNNITIDCNGFKIGGLAAGDGSLTDGIRAVARQNVTIRHCNIRGFYRGIALTGASTGGGQLVEDNRLDNNLYTGISVDNPGGVIRRNQVNSTGGALGKSAALGIDAWVDVIDNEVNGVFSVETPDNSAIGIRTGALRGLVVRGNRIRGLVQAGAGTAIGIRTGGYAGDRLEGNHVHSASAINGYGIYATTGTFCIGNTVTNFSTGIALCDLVGDTNASN